MTFLLLAFNSQFRLKLLFFLNNIYHNITYFYNNIIKQIFVKQFGKKCMQCFMSVFLFIFSFNLLQDLAIFAIWIDKKKLNKKKSFQT
jgi:hypothetical protein